MRDQLGKEFQNIGEDIWIKSVEKQIKDNNNEKTDDIIGSSDYGARRTCCDGESIRS